MFGNGKLKGKQIAILATDGVEQSEILEPKKALEKEGAETKVISLRPGEIKTWKDGDWSKEIPVDLTINEASPGQFDALLLPGGVINADKLRADQQMVNFVEQMIDAGKPIAAICHAAWILAETKKGEGRQITSWPSLKTDLINSGFAWIDQEVVTDSGWVTSRKPEDIPSFNAKMIEEFAEGEHSRMPKSSGF